MLKQLLRALIVGFVRHGTSLYDALCDDVVCRSQYEILRPLAEQAGLLILGEDYAEPCYQGYVNRNESQETVERLTAAGLCRTLRVPAVSTGTHERVFYLADPNVLHGFQSGWAAAEAHHHVGGTDDLGGLKYCKELVDRLWPERQELASTVALAQHHQRWMEALDAVQAKRTYYIAPAYCGTLRLYEHDGTCSPSRDICTLPIAGLHRIQAIKVLRSIAKGREYTP